jgi:Putative Ig domain
MAFASFVLTALMFSACGGSPLKFSPDELYPVTLYQNYQQTISVSGNSTPVSFIGVTKGALPDGLVLAYDPGSSSAVISGEPTNLGRFTFTVTARCEGGLNGSHAYTIAVTRD